MFTQLSLDILLLLMLYAMGATVSAGACIYLLFRRGNAFARRIKTPSRLRRWTAAFFGIMAAGHLWYLPAAIVADDEAATLWMLIGALLDCLLTIPVAIIVLLCMLQDKHRPLWPVWLISAPLTIMMAVSVGMRSYALLPWLRGYFALMGIALTAYMVRAVQQYGRWLRDNFADLEHKEVWQSFVVLAVVVLMFGIYASGNGGLVYEYIIQVCGIALVAYLLWRVETLQDLNQPPMAVALGETTALKAKPYRADAAATDGADAAAPDPIYAEAPDAIYTDATFEQIGALLKERCEDTRLYLRHGLTLTQLAQDLGTNRTYLGLYFARQNTTYNTYINDLRIFHFVSLYREAMAAGRPVTAQQLATESGYRSYSTFGVAFRQRMGVSVKEWTKTD